MNKHEILAVNDRKTEEVEVPEWNGKVIVSVMSGTERDRFDASISGAEKPNLENIRARLCVLTIVDEKGDRIFSEDDIPALGEKASPALDRIFRVAQRLNGLTEESVKDLEKNSATAPGGNSSSA